MSDKLNFKIFPSVNKVIRFFIIGDLFLWSGWGFVDPLFAIYVTKDIVGSSLLSLGYLAAIYWLTKSIAQVPISLFLDKTDGEKDDFYALIFGLLISGMAAFSFIAAKTITAIYIIQFVKAIGFAMYLPAWSAIFTRHLDKEHSAFEWAVSSSSVGLGIGAAGLLGSVIANHSGIEVIFLITGLMAIFSASLLLMVPNLILPKKTKTELIISDHIRAGLK
ncbi:MAG: MFS transporter [Candidatus Pacebacteria bacterium]|nr:MFS transporter [Candidatus Paceibacterota bacterium]